MLEVRNPVSGETVGRVPCDSSRSAAERLAYLKGYDQALTAQDRSGILRRAADLLQSRKEDFAVRITQEAGTCIKESRREVDRAYGNPPSGR